jgi:putative toxin-antitoxin system antitoxin component (TIGR02293 family)
VDVSSISPAIWKRAVDVFGDEKKASRWFATPLSELDGRTPEEVVESDSKADAVLAVLDRIDYGVFS